MMPSCPQRGEPLGQTGRHVLFVNFDGVDVRPGDNALENQGLRDGMSTDPIELPPYDPKGDRRLANILEIHKKIAGFYADMNLEVVISRPLSGDYQMTVVGGKESAIGLNPPVVGISPGDCKNAYDANLNYAFSASLGEDPGKTAVTIAHEAGHAYGLGHTQNMKDIMYPSVSPAEGFREGAAADAGPCRFKPGDRQDSHRVLMENLGGRPLQAEKPGMREPPTVEILSPAESVMSTGTVTLAVKASSSAPNGIEHVTLGLSMSKDGVFRGNHPVAELRPPQSAAQVRLSNPGNYLLTATAYDHMGNVAVMQRSFNVASIACTVANDCTPGQLCVAGACKTPVLSEMPPAGMMSNKRPYGTACDNSQECAGGICAITPVGQICTHYCNPSRLCDGGLECTDGICLPTIYPRATPKVGQLGGKCSSKKDCFTGECSAFVDTMTPRYCTKPCAPEVAWSCPGTMECTQTEAPGGGGQTNLCLLKKIDSQSSEMGSGGCTLASGSPAQSIGGLFSLGLAALALRFRRRQRATSHGTSCRIHPQRT